MVWRPTGYAWLVVCNVRANHHDLFLLFDAAGRLVAVDAQRHGLTGALAIAYLNARALSLGQAVGSLSTPRTIRHRPRLMACTICG